MSRQLWNCVVDVIIESMLRDHGIGLNQFKHRSTEDVYRELLNPVETNVNTNPPYSIWVMMVRRRLDEVEPMLMPGMADFLLQPIGPCNDALRAAWSSSVAPATAIDQFLGCFISRDAEAMSQLLTRWGMRLPINTPMIVGEVPAETMH